MIHTQGSSKVKHTPVEEVVCNLGVEDHASLIGKDLREGGDAVCNHLGVAISQHLIQDVHKVHL